MVAVFNVNKSAQTVSGVVQPRDVMGLVEAEPRVEDIAVYQRSTGTVTILNSKQSDLTVSLAEFGHDLVYFCARGSGCCCVWLPGQVSRSLGFRVCEASGIERAGALAGTGRLWRLPCERATRDQSGRQNPTRSCLYLLPAFAANSKREFRKQLADHEVELALAE